MCPVERKLRHRNTVAESGSHRPWVTDQRPRVSISSHSLPLLPGGRIRGLGPERSRWLRCFHLRLQQLGGRRSLGWGRRADGQLVSFYSGLNQLFQQNVRAFLLRQPRHSLPGWTCSGVSWCSGCHSPWRVKERTLLSHSPLCPAPAQANMQPTVNCFVM
jgi:hypothetical protein